MMKMLILSISLLLPISISSWKIQSKSTRNNPSIKQKIRIGNAIFSISQLRMGRTLEEDMNIQEQDSIARLHPDIDSMLNWIASNGGYFNAKVDESREGWSLSAKCEISVGDILISIPKMLCFYSDPNRMQIPLLDNTKSLMDSLGESQWRARLAIALLSERVKPNSFFNPYLRNLPFEFWGVPVFYTAAEFRLMQDPSLMESTRDRCRFLAEFAEQVLGPLHKTDKDPFSGIAADVNAFGWGFASAASRALRHPNLIGANLGRPAFPFMVPAIDIAQHSAQPTCRVIDGGQFYSLVALQPLSPGAPLTIDYGPLSNSELLADYGFTVDDNPNDKVVITFDDIVLNTARAVMSQSGYSLSENSVVQSGRVNNDSIGPLKKLIRVGRNSDIYQTHWLHNWQLFWLQSIGLHGPTANFELTIGGPDVRNVDPRLWAMLRIIYTDNESDLLKHGYNPKLLQQPGSLIAADREAHVVRSLIGIVTVVLQAYGTDLENDLNFLQFNIVQSPQSDNPVLGVRRNSASNALALSAYLSQTSTDVVKSDALRILRNTFKLPHTNALSPTVRRMAALAESERKDRQIQSSMDSATKGESLQSGERVESRIEGRSDLAPQSLEDLIRSGLKSENDFTDVTKFSDRTDGNSYNNNMINKSAFSDGDSEVAVKVNIPPANIGGFEEMGRKLSVNVREAYRFRIRRKKMLADLIRNLASLHQALERSSSSIANLDELIATTPDEKWTKQITIKDILGEVSQQKVSKKDVINVASSLSSKWREKGTSL